MYMYIMYVVCDTIILSFHFYKTKRNNLFYYTKHPTLLGKTGRQF